MKKIIAIVVVSMIFTQGCAWFVPSAIKRETSLVAIDVKTAGKEVPLLLMKSEKLIESADALAATGNKNEASEQYKKAAEQATMATEKILRSYSRILPHVDNLERYMLREKPLED